MTGAAITERIEAGLREVLRCFGPDVSPEQVQVIKADLRMQFDYPGRYVAYIDDWTEGEGSRVLDRRVLASGPSYPPVREQTKDHPLADRIEYEYCADPDGEWEPIPEDLDCPTCASECAHAPQDPAAFQ